MRALLKIGFSLLLLAFGLIGVAYAMLRANGVSAPTEGRTVATEVRKVGPEVRTIELSGPIDLNLRYGATPSLKVSGEQRLLGNVETIQDGDLLHIGTRGIVLRHRRPLEVELVLPALSGVTVDGSGDSSINGFSGERLVLELNGSGSVRFNGRYRDVKANLHGSGELDVNAGSNIDQVRAELMGSGHMTLVGTTRVLRAHSTGTGHLDAEHLRAESVTVRQAGSGSSSIHARRSANVTLSGSGDVEIHGNPDRRDIARTGTGDVSFGE